MVGWRDDSVCTRCHAWATAYLVTSCRHCVSVRGVPELTVEDTRGVSAHADEASFGGGAVVWRSGRSWSTDSKTWSPIHVLIVARSRRGTTTARARGTSNRLRARKPNRRFPPSAYGFWALVPRSATDVDLRRHSRIRSWRPLCAVRFATQRSSLPVAAALAWDGVAFACIHIVSGGSAGGRTSWNPRVLVADSPGRQRRRCVSSCFRSSHHWPNPARHPRGDDRPTRGVARQSRVANLKGSRRRFGLEQVV